MSLLKFSPANSKLKKLERKLKKKVYSFSMLSGHTCCYAKNCLSKAVLTDDGLKIEDGPDTEFRCYSASEEVLYSVVYAQRKYNSDLVKSCGNNIKKIEQLIGDSLPERADYIRIHVAGDFITLNYFIAWKNVAKNNPNKTFYAYTKSLPFWVAEKNDIPKNLILTASYGGKMDHLIGQHNLRFAKVVGSAYEARKLKLPVDTDDSHAAKNGKSFALIVHGQQRKGSRYAKIVAKNRKRGKVNA